MSRLVYPDYNNSILNTITSILKHYNVDTKHTSLNILDNVLKNNRNTDVKIEKLQRVVEDYIRRSKKQ